MSRKQSAPLTKMDFPALACPLCGIERAPRSLNKNGSVTYSCPPDHKKHGNRFTWRILKDGSMAELTESGHYHKWS
jgi:hypothetical protein